MKKLSSLLAVLLLTAGFAFAAPSAEGTGSGQESQGQAVSQTAPQYQANFDEIEALFNDAESVTETVPFDRIEEAMSAAPEGVNSDTNLIIAIVLWFFGLGAFGLHRVILGGRPLLILLYFITCGGIFGIVPFVDVILMIVDAVNGGGTRFENNDRFIAW